MNRDETKLVSENRKARHDYFVDETYEAGLVLTGTEVKSLRLGHANLRDGYAAVADGELFLYNVHISPFEQGNRFNHEPLRKRKLLMHKAEIARLLGRVREKGYTIIPLKMYFKHGRAKIEIGLARGKKQFDKRHEIAERDVKREIDRSLRDKGRE